jgi:hypothetical protein
MIAFPLRIKVPLVLGRVATGWLSLVSSSILVYKIVMRFRVRRQSSVAAANTDVTTYHRILLGLSAVDALFSMGCAAGPLAVPSSVPGATFGHGTTATCAAQGAAYQLLPATIMYTAALNTYFMLKIRYNVQDVVLSRRYEPWLHAIPILFASASTSTGLALKIFNPLPVVEVGCWIAAYPPDCENFEPHTCTRGQGAIANPSSYIWYIWTFSFLWLLAAFIVVLINSVLIYTAIRHQERRNDRYKLQMVVHKPTTTTTPDQTCTDGRPQRHANAKGSALLSSEETENNSCVSNDENNEKKCYCDETEPQSSKREQSIQNELVASALHSPTMVAPHATLESDVDSMTSVDIPQQPTSVVVTSSAVNTGKLLAAAQQKAKHSRVAACQSTLYCCATLVPFLVLSLPWFGTMFHASPYTATVFLFLLQYLLPTQGIFNLLIYMRPPYKRLRETKPEWSRTKCFRICLFSLDPKYW